MRENTFKDSDKIMGTPGWEGTLRLVSKPGQPERFKIEYDFGSTENEWTLDDLRKLGVRLDPDFQE